MATTKISWLEIQVLQLCQNIVSLRDLISELVLQKGDAIVFVTEKNQVVARAEAPVLNLEPKIIRIEVKKNREDKYAIKSYAELFHYAAESDPTLGDLYTKLRNFRLQILKLINSLESVPPNKKLRTLLFKVKLLYDELPEISHEISQNRQLN